MGSSCIFLKNRLDYSSEKMIRDIMECSQSLELELLLQNDLSKVDFDNDTIYGNVMMPNDFQFALSVFATSSIHDELENNNYTKFDSTQELRFVFEVDYDLGSENYLLKFVLEYLKRNPNDYIWFQDEWAYSYEDVTNINQSSFDYEWCYKPVKKY